MHGVVTNSSITVCVCVFVQPLKVTTNQVQWSVRYCVASSSVRWLNGESPDDLNRNGCRNVDLLSIQPPEATQNTYTELYFCLLFCMGVKLGR